jgi:inhibitor of cysteine peptidase
MRDKNLKIPIFIAGIVLIGLVAAAGLYFVSAQTPSNTAPSNGVFGAGDNGKTVTINDGSTFSINLTENPSTGYSWNVSSTSGLTITNDTYTQGASMPGASGTHEWTIKATGKGQQQFTAVYKRPWEPTTGNETTFTLNVKVV